MNLDDIRNGARVFLDASVLIHGIRRSSAQCRGLLIRCASGSVEGVISTVVLAEVGHRRMMEEAKAKGLIGSNPARALGTQPELVRQLSGYAEEIRDLLGGGLAVARRLNITEVATTDRGFDAVQGLVVYKPSDLALP